MDFNLEELWQRCERDLQRDPAVWISRCSRDALHAWAAQAAQTPAPALRGLTLAVKDNIDLTGLPTTAACPSFAYQPQRSATVVEKLCAAGMIPVGKTNLDQFATGLVGTRSPYGAVQNVLAPGWVSGGSSSGSAAAVAAGLVDAALGTDTAGSGRVPAALNGIIGLKPTRGRLSTRGVVPACRALDCVSLFSRSVHLAAQMLAAAEGFDAEDAYSRALPTDVNLVSPIQRIGVVDPAHLDWAGNTDTPGLYHAACQRLEQLGYTLVPVDIRPLIAAGRLLYEGQWPAERAAGVGEFIAQHQQDPSLDPTVAQIILGGQRGTAVEAFRGFHQLQALRAQAEAALASVDAWVLPTVTTAYTIAQVQADPVRLNAQFGLTNNFMNLCDLCGLTLPAGRLPQGPGFGITVFARAFADYALLELGTCYQGEASLPLPTGGVDLAVFGAHLAGQPLHHQLTERGARLVASTTTSTDYHFYALAGTTPPKPGLVRVSTGGAAIACEVYRMSAQAFGSFVAAVPPPLTIGTVQLSDGSSCKGFLCEPGAIHGAKDITKLGSWRAFLAG